jgi:5-(carboxyamino)imidazole ribonucleotide mutase
MPGGVPVATVALNGSLNAGILAAQIIGTAQETVKKKLYEYKQELLSKVMEAREGMK